MFGFLLCSQIIKLIMSQVTLVLVRAACRARKRNSKNTSKKQEQSISSPKFWSSFTSSPRSQEMQSTIWSACSAEGARPTAPNWRKNTKQRNWRTSDSNSRSSRSRKKYLFSYADRKEEKPLSHPHPHFPLYPQKKHIHQSKSRWPCQSYGALPLCYSINLIKLSVGPSVPLGAKVFAWVSSWRAVSQCPSR